MIGWGRAFRAVVSPGGGAVIDDGAAVDQVQVHRPGGGVPQVGFGTRPVIVPVAGHTRLGTLHGVLVGAVTVGPGTGDVGLVDDVAGTVHEHQLLAAVEQIDFCVDLHYYLGIA